MTGGFLQREVAVLERTLAIIKPDAVERNLIGKIVDRLEDAGLRPRAMRMIHLDRNGAAGFYAVHRERPFFDRCSKRRSF